MIRIIEAETRHLGLLALRMSLGDEERFYAMGRDGRRVMRSFYRESSYRRTAMLDDVPVAIWGVTGPLTASTGILWLYLSDLAKRHPLAVIREAKRELDKITETHRELVCYLHDDDPTSKRFAEFFGFDVGAPFPIEGTGLVGYRGVLCRS